MSNDAEKNIKFVYGRDDIALMVTELTAVEVVKMVANVASDFSPTIKKIMAVPKIIKSVGNIITIDKNKLDPMPDIYQKQTNYAYQIWENAKDELPNIISAIAPFGNIIPEWLMKTPITLSLDSVEYGISKMAGYDDAEYQLALEERINKDIFKFATKIAGRGVKKLGGDIDEDSSTISTIAGTALNYSVAGSTAFNNVSQKLEDHNIKTLQDTQMTFKGLLEWNEELQKLMRRYEELEAIMEGDLSSLPERRQNLLDAYQDFSTIMSNLTYLHAEIGDVSIKEFMDKQVDVEKVEKEAGARLIEVKEEIINDINKYENAYHSEIERLEKWKKHQDALIKRYTNQISTLDNEIAVMDDETSKQKRNELTEKLSEAKDLKERYNMQEKVYTEEYYDSIVRALLLDNSKYKNMSEPQKSKLKEETMERVLQIGISNLGGDNQLNSWLTGRVSEIANMSEETLKEPTKTMEETWEEKLGLIRNLQEKSNILESNIEFQELENTVKIITNQVNSGLRPSDTSDNIHINKYNKQKQEIESYREQADQEAATIFQNQGLPLLNENNFYQQIDDTGKMILENMAKSMLEEQIYGAEQFKNKYKEYFTTEQSTEFEMYQNIIGTRAEQLFNMEEDKKNAFYDFEKISQAFENGETSIGEYQRAYQKMIDIVGVDYANSFGYGTIEDFDAEINEIFDMSGKKDKLHYKEQILSFTRGEFNRLKEVGEKNKNNGAGYFDTAEYVELQKILSEREQIEQTANALQQLTEATADYETVYASVEQDMEISDEQMQELAQNYEGIQDNAVQTVDGWKLQEGALDSVTEKVMEQRDELEKQLDSEPMQELQKKIVDYDERLRGAYDLEEAKRIVEEKKAEGKEAGFTDEELARYVEINQKLKKTNSQMERKQLTEEKQALEQQAKKKAGSGQVVQRVNPLAEYMELVNHKKNMGEYDDDLLKYVNDLQYAYQNLAKTQKEKWALEEQIYQAKKAYRAQLINEVADSERFTQDAYQTMEGYKRLLSSGAGFTEKELKEIYYNMDQAQARAYAQYLQMAQGKYQKTGNERQYVNDLQWGLENRAYTEEQRWQYNREIEQSYLRQAKYAYERSGDERAYLRELDTRISDATLTEQERYQVLQECLGVYEKMTQEAKAQRDILKDSQTALIDFYKNELSVAVDPKKRSMAYDDLFVAANNTVAEAHTQQTESTRLANLYREELQNKFGIWDSDKFFNIRGEIVQSAVEQQLERLPEEQRARFQELIAELEKQKKEWYEMEQARLGAISTLQQAYGELQAQQQKAYNKVVDMIRKRKQQELEALEEVHKKRSEQLTDELKQAEKVYERQLNLLDDLKSNDDYQRRLQKETEIRDKLQQRIDLLALDDSDSARMQRLELEKQLREQEERIAEMQREHEYSEIRKALEEDWKKQQESIEKMQEDNDDRFEREQEKLDERYSEKNIANEANQVLATGQFTEFKEEAIHSYNDIYTHGVRVTQELTNAWKNYAVETGEYFNDLNRYEFTNLFHNLSLITDDMQKIGYWLEAFGYNPNVVFDKTGNGGDTTQTGMSYAHNYQLLLQDIKYRDDELSRTMDVIASRRDKGLSVADQKDYLKTIVDMMLTDFRIGAQGSHKYNKDTLDAVMRQYYYGINGGVEKEYGEAERLYSYLKNDAALRRERIEEIEAYGKIYGLSEGQRAYLDALKALGGAAGYSVSGAVAAAYQDQAAYGQFAPTMNLTPVIQNTNTIGDVYINVEGSADAQTVQALQDAGGTILDQLGTELRGSGMRL